MLYLFTDGGSLYNGRPGCVASWAYELVRAGPAGENEISIEAGSGRVDGAQTNNRGEFQAILSGLRAVARLNLVERPIIVTDSKYAIQCVTQWAPNWMGKKREGKKNLDLIDALVAETPRGTVWEHTRSHQLEPAAKGSREHFVWRHNSRVDEMCTAVLNAGRPQYSWATILA